MEYKQLVKDFAERTLSNLESIERLKTDDPGRRVYETTQLINSLLGLIVLPREQEFMKIPATPLSELVEQGWAIPKMIVDHPKTPDLQRLIHYLRNAVAHFRLEFMTDGRELIGVKMWNEPKHGSRDWEVDLLLEELRDITKRFSTLLNHNL